MPCPCSHQVHEYHLFNARWRCSSLCLAAGDDLLIWDPQGSHLADSQPDGSGVGKQYRLTGTQLAGSFADQFAPWGFAGVDVGSHVGATLLRLPLRRPGGAQDSSISQVAPACLSALPPSASQHAKTSSMCLRIWPCWSAKRSMPVELTQ